MPITITCRDELIGIIIKIYKNVPTHHMTSKKLIALIKA